MSRYVIAAGDTGTDPRHVLSLGRHLPDLTEERYAKYYARHPLGSPHFVFARPADEGQPVGMAALFPVRLRIESRPVLVGIAGDLVVDPAHRSLGPAVLLERSLLDLLRQSEFRFSYAMPNPAAEPVFRRVGYAELGRLARFVRLLKTEFAVRTYVRAPRPAAAAAKVLDVVIGVTSRERWRVRRGSLAVEEAAQFDERFAPLWTAAFERHVITGDRDAELLNWKYELGTPPGRFSLVAATEGDSVRGYAVTVDRKEIRHVVDVLFDAPGVCDALMSHVIRRAREAGVSAVCVDYFGPANDLTRRLRAFGFLRRSARPLMVFVPDGESLPELSRRENWHVLGGDEDV